MKEITDDTRARAAAEEMVEQAVAVSFTGLSTQSEVVKLMIAFAADAVAQAEQAEEIARLRAMLNNGFCRKCGETYAPNSGSDPEHRWPY